MTTLAALGFGYCARHLVARHPTAFARVIGTARTAETAHAMPAGVEAQVFDGETLGGGLAEALMATDVLLLSAPPDARGDPVLRVAGAALERAPLSQVIYLTTLGVYGDHQGGWVDEATPPRPSSPRLERRLEAEACWLDWGARRSVPVAVLRLAGIYGPGRNVLRQLRAGEARPIVKDGQVFNRIHVDDIAAAILAVVARRFAGIVNVTDDLPAPSCDPIFHGARLMDLPAPPVIPFAEAARTMSPIALSFWDSSKRVANGRLKRELGVTLAYPTYRDGLQALFEAGEGRPA